MSTWRAIKKYRTVYLMLVPAVVITFAFAYLPMFSNYMAFLDYDFNNGWFGLQSPFVGLKNFSFVTSPEFHAIAGRTLLYSVTLLVFSFPAPLIFALLLNEIRNTAFKRFAQTVSYIPHFVSWVTVAGLFYLFLSTDITGLVNNIRQNLLNLDRLPYMQESQYFLPFLVLSELWKELGWGSIIYLAALTGIDTHLFEAAQVDGASRWQQCWHITLPSLIPTTCILLIFALGRIFSSNFDQVFNMQNSITRAATDTINVHVYYRGVMNRQYAYAAAMGLFQGLISFILVMGTNFTTKKLSGSGII